MLSTYHCILKRRTKKPEATSDINRVKKNMVKLEFLSHIAAARGRMAGVRKVPVQTDIFVTVPQLLSLH